MNAGANDYLVKSFESEELLARVEVGRRMVEIQAALAEQGTALPETEPSHSTGILTAIEGFWLAEQRERESLLSAMNQ